MKIPARLHPLLEDGLIDAVIRPLMSGKEAAVYLVEARGEVCVAKVYKEANRRSFRQRAAYTEGRKVRNSRRQRAMDRGSRYGRAQQEVSWQSTEVDMLYRLADAGVAVPQPHLFTDGVLLMELIKGHDGSPAPRLWDMDFPPPLARRVHQFLTYEAVKMLCCGVVHGDLSEYNVLFSDRGPVIIDLPQAVDAAGNNNARRLFLRDVGNFTRFLSRWAPELEHARFGEEIWSLYEKGKLFPDSPLTGRFARSNRRANLGALRTELRAVEDERPPVRVYEPEPAANKTKGKGNGKRRRRRRRRS